MEEALTPSSALTVPRMKANPNAPPPPKALTKAALDAEAKARDALRKEFLAMQEAVKNTEIAVPFVFFDGTSTPAGSVKMRKGDHIWLFLDRCRKVGAEMGVGRTSGTSKARKEWARISVDDLMLVKGDVIVPHVSNLSVRAQIQPAKFISAQHYDFYYFIANRVPSFSRAGGLLFNYSDKPLPTQTDDKNPLHRSSEQKLEGADNDASETKVVDRRWYERNKHIFPASLWNEFEPGKEFEEKMTSTRRDALGNTFFF